VHTPRLNLPNRERLKPHAVEFTSAYCTYPLCSPSRSTVMTGRYPHENGILTNVDFAAKNPSLSTSIPNLGRVFSEAGYRTVYFGKWHLSRRAHYIGNLFRYGFDSPHVSNQLVAIGSDPRVTQNAAQWIRNNRKKSPWLMIYSPINPHDICLPVLDKYYPGDRDYPVSVPPNFEHGHGPAIKTLQGHHAIKSVEKMLPSDEQGWLDYLKFYCYLLENVDVNLGQVLDALEETDQRDNTVLIFTSDHGEMGGSHGLAHKGPTMYEENIHIPLWISDPRQVDGYRQCNSLVSNLDLVPTLCSIAGTGWPDKLQGIDLSPMLAGSGLIERDHLFCEGSPRTTAVWRGIRTREWKYWHYMTGEELLFNISQDPLEMKNLAADPGARDMVSGFRGQVRQWRRETNDPFREFMG
jgi:arylsulfatase A-like enzyme